MSAYVDSGVLVKLYIRESNSAQAAAVLQHSIALSRSFTAQTLARSLDIVHVALALHLQCRSLITADTRQAEFARCCKLPVVFIS